MSLRLCKSGGGATWKPEIEDADLREFAERGSRSARERATGRTMDLSLGREDARPSKPKAVVDF